jgi:chromosomal replication initiation ATPase DnaA
MAQNEVIQENLFHTFEALHEGNVTLKFGNFY